MAGVVVGALMEKSMAELLVLLGQLWVALLLGLVLGWVWKPKWAAEHLGYCKTPEGPVAPQKASVSRVFSSLRLDLIPGFSKVQPQSLVTEIPEEEETFSATTKSSYQRLSEAENERLVVKLEDLDYLCQLVEVKDGGSPWIPMMDRSTAKMSYQAWRREPETGPPQYRTGTVFEDATPELVRDFFWDDEFRAKWDDMLINASILEECPSTGTMVVRWVRKFPFFCSDREYIIGRRIWESGRSYYCVTKGLPYDSIPRQNKPRRVDLYYSSWCIRAVESNRGDGQMTACEVLLFHYEDMGIPREIAKLGVRQGMWGAVKKIEPGLRAYQTARRSGNPPSRCAFIAQINSKIDPDHLRLMETASNDSSEDETGKSPQNHWCKNIPKLLVVGGAVALACSLDQGLPTKALIFGVAKRFGKQGKRL